MKRIISAYLIPTSDWFHVENGNQIEMTVRNGDMASVPLVIITKADGEIVEADASQFVMHYKKD